MAAPSWCTKQVTQQRIPKRELVKTRQYLIKKNLAGNSYGWWWGGVPVNVTEEADLDGLPDPCLS